MPTRSLTVLLLVSLFLLGIFGPRMLEAPISYALFGGVTGLELGLFFLLYRNSRLDSLSGKNEMRMRIWKRIARNKNAMFGLVVLIVLSYLAILAPFVSPHDPLTTDWGALSQHMSADHWLGTDDMGRDIFARTLFGIRVALGIGVTAVVINTIIGTFLGLVAGYFGGRLDAIIMRLLEVWNSIPFILLAIAIMAALGTGIAKLILIVSLSNLMAFARIIRGEVMSVREADYISAAKVIGIPAPTIMFRHVLPNCISPILVMASLSVGETILVIAGLSFLGLGVQPPMPSLGSMLSNGQQFLHENLLMSVVPGCTILLIVLSFNLFGDGVRDGLDSRLGE